MAKSCSAFSVLCLAAFCQPSWIMKIQKLAQFDAYGVHCQLLPFPHDSRSTQALNFSWELVEDKTQGDSIDLQKLGQCAEMSGTWIHYNWLHSATTIHNWPQQCLEYGASIESYGSHVTSCSSWTQRSECGHTMSTAQTVQCSIRKPWPLSLKADRPATSSSWERLEGPAHQIVSNSVHRTSSDTQHWP